MTRESPARTHDREIYLREDRYEKPKEAFKVLADLIAATGLLDGGGVVGDVGCATGEFLYYLRTRFPAAALRGYDLLPELLDRARERVPDATFVAGSALDPELAPAGSLDVAVMSGVHSIFDDFETPFSNLLRWTRPGGRIFVWGLFNPHPVDVWVSYRHADDPDRAHREPGWNVFSRASVSRFLDAELGAGRHSFTPFELPFDLAPNPDDPVRTWTFRDAEQRRLFANGLSLLCNIDILEIAR